jgi:hypothetical protein
VNPHWLAPPRPWHVLLSPALPILALWSFNFDGLVTGAAVWSIAALEIAAVVASLVLGWLMRDLRRAALAVSVVTLIALSQSTVWNIGRLTHVLFLPPLSLMCAVILAVFILRSRVDLKAWTTFGNALMLISTLLVVQPTVMKEARRWQHPTRTFGPVEVPAHQAKSLPDIYFVILDGYGRADVLRDYFHFDNPLVPQLEAQGFTIPSKAASNYTQTALSLASSLNLDYLQTVIGSEPSNVAPRARLADLIAQNRAFATLAAAGYRIRAYASEYGLLQLQVVDERPHPRLYFTDFEYGVYEGTVLPMLFAAAGRPPGMIPYALHRRHIRWTLDHLEHDLPETNAPPTLVFAHLLIPHPPFAFEPDGRALESRLPANFSDASHWRAQAEAVGSDENYETGYIKGLQFANSRLLQIVKNVMSRSDGRRTIFYVQGDHGPGSRLDWESAEGTDMRERLGILLAVRFPDGMRPPALPANISPINSIRTLIRVALDAQLPEIENRSFFSTWKDPLAFVDVTSHLH